MLRKTTDTAAQRSLRLLVLPFENLGGDPDQQYFADGLTEDILTALGAFHPTDGDRPQFYLRL